MTKRIFLLSLGLSLTSPVFASEALGLGDSKLQSEYARFLSCGASLPADLKMPETTSRTGSARDPVAQLAQDALATDPAVAKFAIAALRAKGPSGLEAMLNTHAELLKSHSLNSISPGNTDRNEAWLRLKTALDSIARQRDSYASKLYWYTDFEQAKAAARVSGKPILSLRLLGNLDEELSCANSRFFRATLYANAEVSAYLRDHFILHWKSVRPVPKVTIDFGDGRKLEGTITGNSIHYVLDSDGQIIDALPGLYGAKAFLAGLQQAQAIAKQCSMAAGIERNRVLHEYHHARLATIESNWSRDLASVRSSSSVDIKSSIDPVRPAQSSSGPPPAAVAARAAVSKSMIERPLLRSAFPVQPATYTQLETSTDDATWANIALLHSEEARLDQSSRALLLAKAPSALTAGRLTTSKIAIENPVLRQLRNLERTISEDTVRNEYLFHSKIHEWLAAETVTPAVDTFNSKIYAELFLTPDSDPWLGLAQPDICTALENNGLVSNTH
jgi:hypothetical protein